MNREESKHVYEAAKDQAGEKFDTSVLRKKRPDDTDRANRVPRQADATTEPEGSGTTEPLLVEDPPGIGLGFILGKNI